MNLSSTLIIMAAILLLLIPAHLSGQSEELLAPVVLIQSGPPGQDELGTGIIVGHSENTVYLISAYHVIEVFPEILSIKVNGKRQVFEGEVVKSVPEQDFVILSFQWEGVDNVPSSFLPRFEAPELMDPTTVIGHPNGHKWDINQLPLVKSLSVQGDYNANYLTLYPTGLSNGNSGGPVLSEDYQLLGIVQQVSQSQALCLRTSFIMRVLNAEAIPTNLMTGITPPDPRDNYLDPLAGQMIWVEAGDFEMGTDDESQQLWKSEGPAHRVSLDGFWMGQHEVTVEAYLRFCRETGAALPEWLEEDNKFYIKNESSLYRQFGFPESGYEQLPVAGISWNQATAYCEWLSDKTGDQYRLPTEAEWEYAARGGHLATNTQFSGSNDPLLVAHFGIGNDTDGIQEVGQLNPNEIGLFDMSGNLWEWCSDWYGEQYYQISPEQNPTGPEFGSYRVMRGGSYGGQSTAGKIFSRFFRDPGKGSFIVGFRIVRQP